MNGLHIAPVPSKTLGIQHHFQESIITQLGAHQNRCKYTKSTEIQRQQYQVNESPVSVKLPQAWKCLLTQVIIWPDVSICLWIVWSVLTSYCIHFWPPGFQVFTSSLISKPIIIFKLQQQSTFIFKQSPRAINFLNFSYCNLSMLHKYLYWTEP